MLVSFPISADALKMLFIKSYSSLGLFCIVLYIDIYIALLIHSFIHSGHFYSVPSSPLLLRGAPHYSTDTVSEFHAKAHRQLQVAQGPYVAARAGVEPTTLRLKVIVSTKAPPRPT